MDIKFYECSLCGKYFGGHSGNFFKARPLVCDSCCRSQMAKCKDWLRHSGPGWVFEFLEALRSMKYMRGAWAD